ncbi:FANCI solenoid 4-domain-containing protein [Umbelopsis sp. AD052]|nr:FANCI solenoid 4-domain-containing protein [Umbelopsis sp. AD052]
MDAHILKLAKKPNHAELEQYLNEQGIENITTLLRDILNTNQKYGTNNDTDPILVFRAVFIGSPLNSESILGRERRLATFMVALNWLSEQIPEKSSPIDERIASMANFLLPEIDSLPTEAIRDVNLFVVDIVRKGEPVQPKLFDLLPKLLVTSVDREVIEVEIEGKFQILSGVEYMDYIIDKLVSCKWHPSYAVGIASAFNEMECTSKQLKRVTEKLLRQLAVLELNELPPLAYQLFLLSRKGEKQLIITKICSHFQDAEEQYIPTPTKRANNQAVDFNRVEGTIIVHMCFAIKQDQDLGSEFLKYIKRNKIRALTPFTLSCMLSMARIHRFEDTVLELLKSTIMSVYKDAEKLEQYPWFRAAEQLGLYKVPIKDMMNTVIDKTTSGWDQVTQSLVQLAVLLLDSSVSSSPFKKPSGRTTSGNLSPTEETARLAIDILARTFKLHDIVRHEIMNHILSRIVTRANSVSYFLDLLDLLGKECPNILMESDNMSKIRETLDYLSYLPLDSAKRLMSSLNPIIQRDNRLKEALMLILRKGLFAKATEGRQIAVHGFLLLVQSIHANAPSGTSSDSSTNSSILEILGLLRRCFSQQPEVRLLVYENLSKISIEHPELASDILAMLQLQFKKYFVADQSFDNPLQLDKCVEQSSLGGSVHTVEPIHSLIQALVKTMVAMRSNNQGTTSSDITSLQGHIDSLCFRLCKADPEDFELDKSSNYDMVTNVGMRNNCRAQLLLSTYEACMEHLIHTYSEGNNNAESIAKLFHKFKILHGILKEKSTNERGRKSGLSMAESSILTLPGITMISNILFVGDSGPTVLRSNPDFVKYILTVTHHKLSKLTSQEDLGVSTYQQLASLAHVYMAEVVAKVGDKDDQTVGDNPAKNQHISTELSLSIECLVLLPQLIHNLYPAKMAHFLVNLLQAAQASQLSTDVDGEILVKHLIMVLQELVEDLITHRTPRYKEAASLLNLKTFLLQCYSSPDPEKSGCVTTESTWIEGFCVDRAIEDQGVAKAALSLLITFSEQQGQFQNIVQVGNDINAIAGDIDSESDTQATQQQPTHFMIVNNSTFQISTTSLFSFLEHEYEGIEWILNRLRLAGDIAQDVGTNSTSQDFEQIVCGRIKVYIGIQIKLASTLLLGATAENFVKTLVKCYKTLLGLIRLKLGTPSQLSPEFCQVVKIQVSQMTDNMYKFLTVYGQRFEELEERSRVQHKGKMKASTNLKEKAKIIRESKLVPNLIYVVEQFEGNLIKLSKKSKVNLMQNMKRSTARDFRIRVDCLPVQSSDEEEEIKRTASVGPDEGRSSMASDSEDERLSTSKRRRMQ